MPQPVLDAVVRHLQDEALLGGYEAADASAAAIERVYDAAATLLGASVDEIAIIENATRAWDMAFYSIPFAPGQRILTAQAEYASNYLAFLQVARRTGAVVEVIPNDSYGQVDLVALRQMIDGRVKLIAVTHVPTNGGLVNPAVEIGQIAREAGVCYLLDACQSVGQMPIDVRAIGCDVLSATGRKYLRGPRGTGLLYVRRAWIERLEPPLIDLHAATWTAPNHYRLRSDARRFENWETNVAGKIGLGVAIDYASGWGLEAIWLRVRDLASRLRSQLRELPGVTVHDLGQTQCGIVSFAVAGHTAGTVRDRLRARQINVSISRLTSTRLDMTARGLDELVRASVHYYNSNDELDQLCDALRAL
jgi:selenocysteine lyase/cysteine desulfurase